MTSTVLQNTRLKEFSGPFDWIFSSIGMVCDCIEDDFSAFLDVQYHSVIPEEARASINTDFAEHALFKDRYGLCSIFNHADPTLPENRAYLVRCVDRFRQSLTETHLMVAACTEDRIAPGDFERLCALLSERGACVADVTIISEPVDGRRIDLRERVGPHTCYRFNPSSPIDGIRFEDNSDNDMLSRHVISSFSRAPQSATQLPLRYATEHC